MVPRDVCLLYLHHMLPLPVMVKLWPRSPPLTRWSRVYLKPLKEVQVCHSQIQWKFYGEERRLWILILSSDTLRGKAGADHVAVVSSPTSGGQVYHTEGGDRCRDP